VAKGLKKKILSGLSPNLNSADSVTIKEVAKSAGVSIATVSRVLNKFSSVKEKNKLRVLEAIEKLGYRPNIFARKLAGGKLNAIGLIIPGYEGIFYSFYAQEIIRNVGLGLERLKKDLLLHIFWGKDKFNSSYIEGVIFSDIINNEEQLKRVLKDKVPCLVLNKKIDNLPVSFVAVDNQGGASEAVNFLVELGHKRIAHISGDLKTQCAQERLSGYRQVLEKAGIDTPDYFVQAGNFSRAQARQAVEFLFKKKVKPTAIFCASDDMAYEVILYLLEDKIRVPEDVSVVGFDDNPQYSYGPVTLTTVHQPLDEMIKTGLKILSEHISGETKMLIQKILPTRLVIGDSTSHALS